MAIRDQLMSALSQYGQSLALPVMSQDQNMMFDLYANRPDFAKNYYPAVESQQRVALADRQENRLQGRFPANIIHDGSNEVLKNFPDVDENDLTPIRQKTLFDEVIEKQLMNASRFFYCAKTSGEERNEGCEKLEDKDGNIKSDYAGMNGETQNKKNNHPTVKPLMLMEYLIKLVSKENAIILDPFLGSGTTGVASYNLNRNFIGIEKEQEYVKIAEARLNNVKVQKKLIY